MYGAFSYNVTAVILVYQITDMAGMLVYQVSSVEGELFSHVNTFFFSSNKHISGHVSETHYVEKYPRCVCSNIKSRFVLGLKTL